MQSSTALLIIDMQLVAFDGKLTPAIHKGDQLLKKIERLITIFRENHLAIVYAQTCAQSGQLYAKDVHGWEIHPAISPSPEDKIVFKENSNGFEETDLETVLLDLGIKHLVTCGIWSEHCVANTSSAALEIGFTVSLAADGHSTVKDNEQTAEEVIANQNRIAQSNNVQVLSIDELSDMLNTKKVHREEIKDKQTSHWDLDLLSREELEKVMSQKPKN